MEKQIVTVKSSKLSTECNTFMQNIEQCLEIANKMTDSFFDGEADENEKQMYNATVKNLDIFIKLFRTFNYEMYKSYSMLNLAGNHIDFNHFTLPESVLDEYKENDVGECIISNIIFVPPNHCHIFNVKKPPPSLNQHQDKRFTRLPEAGEVFAIEHDSNGLYRAVRNNFVNKESESMWIQLIDTGECYYIQNDYKNMYELPKEIQSIKSCAILCKILEIADETGSSVNIGDYIKKLLGKQVSFHIVNVKNNIPLIKISVTNRAMDTTFTADSEKKILVVSDIGSSLNSCPQNETETERIESNDVQLHTTELLHDKQVKPVRQEKETSVNANTVSIANNTNVTNESNYICDICNVGFHALTELKGHMEVHISALKKPLNTKSEPLRSSKLQFQGKKYRQCKVCGKSIKFPYNRHMKTHSTEKPFQCEFKFCGKLFKQKRNLVDHIKLHRGDKPFSCSFCSKAFVRKDHLMNHILIHTGKKQHVCNICSKAFIQRAHLLKHMLTHTGEKQHVCKICGKSFLQKVHLLRHIRIHTGEKPYSCTICELSFTRMTSFKKHKQTHE